MHAPAMVMDVAPWPNGKGFRGSDTWWAYIANQDERKRLDQMFGMALLDETICDRLVHERDETLFRAFGLSEPTKQWIRRIEAESLHDLAQAVAETFHIMG